jgi:hypothetical protein
MSVDTISHWLEFVAATPLSSDGTSTPDLPPTSIFGHYAQRLRDDVFHFLVVSLPNALEIHQQPLTSPERPTSPEAGGRDVLLRIYSHVPFDLFKAAVESPTFQIGPFFQCQYAHALTSYLV